jgi:hypothetical protein
MDIQPLPLVKFGKYKDKCVTELIADKSYVDWLKTQSWFSEKSPIYNIVVNQTINTTNNSKTPEHNKLQNLFLDKNNQKKLLSKLYNKQVTIDIINTVLQDKETIRCFGQKIIPKISDNTTTIFEYKFNWDLYMNYYVRGQDIILTSILETELSDKKKYKEQYDIKERLNKVNNLLALDRIIKELNKLRSEASISVVKTLAHDLINKAYEKNNRNNRIYRLCEKYRPYSFIIKGPKCYSIDEIVNEFDIIRKKYKDDYENNFDKHYENYRLKYYKGMITKLIEKNITAYVSKTNENQYELIIKCNFYKLVLCELKPTLSDDYPCVLRKLNTQIELTCNYLNSTTDYHGYKFEYILLIEKFTSKYTSKEQLIEIFKQHKIQVIFTNEIFETSKSLEIESVNTNKLIEENKFLTDNLLQTRQKLLQAEEKIKYLEEEILSLKS